MLNLLRTRLIQGNQYIKDIRNSFVPKPFRGFPLIKKAVFAAGKNSADVCPSNAIMESPLRIDLGKCVFCGECERACPDVITFENNHLTAVDDRNKLIIAHGISFEGFRVTAIKARREIRRLFGRSFKLRSVSAGGCGACEMELNACSNVNFDMGRFGIEIVASPRHADGVVITGPVTENMAAALFDTYKSIPRPRIVIAMGSCAISGGLFEKSRAVKREFFESFKPDLYIPGCPVHPLTFINGVLDFIRKK